MLCSHPATYLSYYTASPLVVPADLWPTTFLITSASLTSSSTPLTFSSPIEPENSLSLTATEWSSVLAKFKEEGAAVKEVDFLVKGAEATPAAPAAAKPPTAPKTESTEASKGSKSEFENQSGVQLGMTVKKEQAVFGEWYQQVCILSLASFSCS